MTEDELTPSQRWRRPPIEVGVREPKDAALDLSRKVVILSIEDIRENIDIRNNNPTKITLGYIRRKRGDRSEERSPLVFKR